MYIKICLIPCRLPLALIPGVSNGLLKSPDSSFRCSTWTMELTFALVPTLATALLAIALALALAVSVLALSTGLALPRTWFLFSQFGSCFQVSRHCWVFGSSLSSFLLQIAGRALVTAVRLRVVVLTVSLTPFPLRFADRVGCRSDSRLDMDGYRRDPTRSSGYNPPYAE